jgi:hypothetical protein
MRRLPRPAHWGPLVRGSDPDGDRPQGSPGDPQAARRPRTCSSPPPSRRPCQRSRWCARHGAGPRHGGHDHAVRRAGHPRCVGLDNCQHGARIQGPPALPSRAAVIAGTATLTHPAAAASSPGPARHHQHDPSPSGRSSTSTPSTTAPWAPTSRAPTLRLRTPIPAAGDYSSTAQEPKRRRRPSPIARHDHALSPTHASGGQFSGVVDKSRRVTTRPD